MWSLRNFFNTRGASSNTIADKAAIIAYLSRNSSNGKVLGLLCSKTNGMMHVSVESIYNTNVDLNPTIAFNWYEPTGEFLSTFTIRLADIHAICPFDGNTWDVPGIINRYFNSMVPERLVLSYREYAA
jgi:hypothetical protein